MYPKYEHLFTMIKHQSHLVKKVIYLTKFFGGDFALVAIDNPIVKTVAESLQREFQLKRLPVTYARNLVIGYAISKSLVHCDSGELLFFEIVKDKSQKINLSDYRKV